MSPRRDEAGVALVLALLALLVVTFIGLALTTMSALSMAVAVNEREAADAFYLADSGVAHALGLLGSQDGWSSFDAFLRSGDGRACTGDELASEPPNATAYPPPSERIPAAGRRAPPFGSYSVRLCDDESIEAKALAPDHDPDHDANGRILIRSTGSGRDGASATVEAAVARVSLPALLVNGHLRVRGSPSVMGEGGGVHANGTLELEGSPCAEKHWSALATIGGVGAGGPGCTPSEAQLRPGQPWIPLPDLAPSSFRSRADYVLGSDGSIRDGAGASANVSGWSWNPQDHVWSTNGNVPAGTYYAEGNIQVSGDPREMRGPVRLTLVAEGSVDLAGGVRIVPAIAGVTTGYAVVAGGDVRLAGDESTLYLGVFFASDQVEIVGQPTIAGQVFAKNHGDLGYPPDAASPATRNLVRLQRGVMELSGDFALRYDGVTGLLSTRITTWRECRGPDPDDPCGRP